MPFARHKATLISKLKPEPDVIGTVQENYNTSSQGHSIWPGIACLQKGMMT
jgi:hypothetical protein